MPGRALAVETAFGVDAATAETQARRLIAFVYVYKVSRNVFKYVEIFAKFCSYHTHADLHDVAATIAGVTVALEISGSISARTVTTHPVHDLALVDICKKH